MESENLQDISNAFNQIDIEDEPGGKKSSHQPITHKSEPKQEQSSLQPEYVDFQLYIKDNCKNKIKILDRKTFHQIKRPIIICFHHFREKCAYLTKYLDILHQLSLKYDDRMEFIVADMYDIDIIYPGRNPINFYCLGAVEHEYPNIYAINENKWIHEHFDNYQSIENLVELCENLLSGKLYPSQPLPQNNDKNLIKICVYDNYEELVLNSTKNIFLIINLYKYQVDDANYENVALALKDYNLDIIYMEAEENYVPFEYCAFSYPTILFIPFNDKQNFIYYHDCRTEENIIEFLKKCLEQPEYLKLMQQQHKDNLECKNVKVPQDFSLRLTDLSEFLKNHYNYSLKLFDREIILKSKKYIIIAFMDFQEKCLAAHHVEWFNKLYQVAENCYIYDFLIADFKDIDVINRNWQADDLIKKSLGKPRIYGFDRLKNIFEFGNFEHPPSLCYFINDLINDDLFYSQVYDRNLANDLIRNWTARHFKNFIKKSKKHIFLTFYSSDDQEKNEELFNLLQLISNDVKELNVDVVKFDIKFNYLSLEYQQPNYPVHYFIPKSNKKDIRLYVDTNLSKDKMLEFIRKNLE